MLLLVIAATALSSAPPALILQQRHATAPKLVAWRSDEQVLATAGEDGEILLYATADGSVFGRLMPPVKEGPKTSAKWKREVTALRFSANGALLLSVTESDRKPSTAVWDLATRKLLAEVTCAAAGFVDGGETVLCGLGEEQAWLWNRVTSERTPLEPRFSRELEQLELSDDGRFAIARPRVYGSGNDDRRAVIWDLGRRGVTWTGQVSGTGFDAVLMSRAGLALALGDGQALLVDPATGHELTRYPLDLGTAELAGIGAARFFLSNKGQLEARDLKSGGLLGAFGKGTLLAVTADDEAIVKNGGVWQQKPRTDDYHWVHTAFRWDPRRATNTPLARQVHEPFVLSPRGTKFVATRSVDPGSSVYDPVSDDRPVPFISSFPSAERLVPLGVAFEPRRFRSMRTAPGGRSLLLVVGDGEGLSFGEDSPAQPNQLLDWDLESGRLTTRADLANGSTLTGFTSDGTSALLDSQASTLATLSGERPPRALPNARALLAREGTQLVVTEESEEGASGRLALRRLETLAMVRELELVPKTHATFKRWAPVQHVWFREVFAAPDGKYVAAFAQVTGENKGPRALPPWGALFLWDAASGGFLGALDHGGGYPIATTFSPEGKRLAFANGNAVLVYETGTWKRLGTLQGHRDRVAALAFSNDGKLLISGGGGDQGDHSARLWNVDTLAALQVLEAPTRPLEAVALLEDARIAAAASGDGSISFWQTATGALVGRLFLAPTGEWLAVAQDGRYETNTSAEVDFVRWLLPEQPLRSLPIELFMRDLYEPRLLPRKLAGEPFPPAGELGSRLRVQPAVRVVSVKPAAKGRGRVDVEVTVTAPAELTSGVFDLRLFRDRQLVAGAPDGGGRLELDAKGTARVTFRDLQLPSLAKGERVEFSAYAFNAERIKSRTATLSYADPRARRKIARGTAFVVSIGVNEYESPAWNLQFAVNDAERLARGLVANLEKTKRFEKVVSIRLLSRAGEPERGTLPATKGGVRAVFEALRAATPDDLVIISFSGHGYAEPSGAFYLLPRDIGQGSGGAVTPELLERAISTDELAAWLRPVDAGELTLIIDACHSAASIDAAGFKPGPMGSRGLGQLAFDKGMRVLAASQANDVALESDTVRQGLLSYALVTEGLDKAQADSRPSDARITMAEWLEFGVDRVPVLFHQLIEGDQRTTGARRLVAPVEVAKRKPQKPALFDFAQRRRDLPIAIK